MGKFSTSEVDKRIKLLLIAPSGTGKTRQIGFIANAGYNVRVLDVDNNLAIIKSVLKDGADLDFHSLPKDDPESWPALCKMTTHWKTKDEDFGPLTDWTGNDVLVIDSGTFAADVCLAYTLKKASVAPDAPNFDQTLWGVYAKRFINEMARLTSARYKFHLVVTAHVRFMENEQGINKAVPFFGGRMVPTVLPGYFNNTWALENKVDGKHHLLTRATSQFINLRTSAPHVVGPDVIDPDLGKIFREMEK